MIPIASLAAAAIGTLPLAAAQAATRADLDWWVDLLTRIATIVIALALIAIAVAAIALVVIARRAHRHFRAVLGRTRLDLQPIVRQAESVAENVSYVSRAVRTDVERFRSTLTSAQERLDEAAEATEERVRQFNALLRVVQEEAEELFIDTAASVRGVRAGARVLREGSLGPEDGFEEADRLLEEPPARHHL